MTIAQYLRRFKCGSLALSSSSQAGCVQTWALLPKKTSLGSTLQKPCHSELPRLTDVAPLCLACHTHANQFGQGDVLSTKP